MVIATCLSCHFVLAAAVQRGKEGPGGRERRGGGRGHEECALSCLEEGCSLRGIGMAQAKMLKL